jgi:predicted histone-like DNA-binding protein
MSLFIKTYQNKVKKSKAYGKYYGRVQHMGTLEIDPIAEKIQEKCTVHKADIMAVLTALTGVVSEGLQGGQRVHLPGIGTFKLGVRSGGVIKKSDFDLNSDLKGAHVIFQPEKTKDNSAHKYTNPLTRGVRFKLFAFQAVPSTSGSGSDSGDDSGSGSGTTSPDPVEERP